MFMRTYLRLGATISPINCQAATDGTRFMDSTQQAMIAVLKSIRDQADSILKKMERADEQKSLSWKCADCGHAKHFTRPVSAEVAAPCPKCGGTRFELL
jgi:Zn finger protein HypA/HybF involved in hydrogenase expression